MNGNHRVCAIPRAEVLAKSDEPMFNGVSFLHRVDGANYDYHGEVPWYGDWNSYDYPYYPSRMLGWIEAHFPNMWDGVAEWTNFLGGVNDAPDRFLAKNTAMNNSQYYYNHNATIAHDATNREYTIDTSAMPESVYTYNILGPLVLKTPLGGLHINEVTATNGAELLGTWEDDYGYGYVMIGDGSQTMGRLAKGTYKVKCFLGEYSKVDSVDLKKNTYNVYDIESTSTKTTIDVVMYGKQTIVYKTKQKPVNVYSLEPKIKIEGTYYNHLKSEYSISCSSTDIQGAEGKIVIIK